MAVLFAARPAGATPPTPGYPEPVVQWGVQKGETCDDIAKSLYGSPRYVGLLQRYNHVSCKAGAPLREGLTLVLPEKPTTLPDARLRSMNPDVRARPGGGAWSPAATGMPLFSNYNVNTLDQGRADVEFIDRTRVFLAPNTLVVIYGTASNTQVSKSIPAVVEVDAGEVKAALAALRGEEPVEVAIKGGGHVSASSRDTVVQRKGDRTTVAVFEGKAGVTAGGKSVQVPTNYGTRFVGVTPPAPPRPLPPAPAWAGSVPAVVLVTPVDDGGLSPPNPPRATGVFDASWVPVPKARQYRIELLRERDKGDGTTETEILSRTEVPATINAFHGEKLEIGAYRLQVRAIDQEEYLGVAADHGFRFVEARVELGHGSIAPGAIDANPYGVLHLGASKELEMALDDGPFGPMLDTLDLRRRAPQAIRLRRRGGTAVETIPVHYAPVKATLEMAAAGHDGGDPHTPGPAGENLSLHVRLSNVDGIDVGDRIHPSARAHLPGGVQTIALTAAPDGSLQGALSPAPAPGSAPVRVDIVDDRGAVLGTAEYTPATPERPPPPVEGPPLPQIGPYAPIWQATTGADVLAFAPTAPNQALVSTSLLHGNGGWTAQGQLRASGLIGPVGIEADLHTNTADGGTAVGAGWLGARVRVFRLDGALIEVAPAVRVGFPLSASGLPAQIEPAAAIGGAAGRFTWLVDFGGRFRTASDGSGTDVPLGQGFILAAGTMDFGQWVRIHAALDGHVLFRDLGAKQGIAGLGAGVEVGRVVYGALGLHLSPWSDPGVGPFLGQLALGLRGLP